MTLIEVRPARLTTVGFAAVISLILATLLLLPGTALAAPPPNDDFANAQAVGPALPVSVPSTNAEATAQPGEPAVAGNAAVSTVWFRWTAPANAVVVVDLCNDDFTGPAGAFKTIEVYTGAALGALVSQAAGAGTNCFVRFNAVLGQEYKFQVDYRFNQGNFNFRMRSLTPPANDGFAGSTVVGPALPVSLPASNVDSTWQVGEPAALGGSSFSRSVWFSWTAPANGPVRVDVCDFKTVSGPANRKLVVYTGAAIGALVAVTPISGNCEQTFAATAGTIYRIAFSGDIAGEGSFTLRIRSAPPPANDDFADALAIGPALPVNVTGSNEFAGVEVGEPDHGGLSPARSIWYSWTPSESQRVTVRSCSKDFTARVGIYTGPAVNTLTTQGEEPPFAPYCQLPLDAVAGTTYWIAIGGGSQDGVYGDTLLRIRKQQVPSNDGFAQARTLSLKADGKVNGTTIDASTEPSEPSHEPGSYGGGGGGSVWYQWTAPSARPVILSACSKTEPVNLAVYTGGSLGDLTQVAASLAGCPFGSQGGKLALAPTKGQTYRIAVASRERDFDTPFTLSSKGPFLAPKKFDLKKKLKDCRKVNSKSRRKRCERDARRKNAVLKCQSRLDAAQQSKCVKDARRRF